MESNPFSPPKSNVETPLLYAKSRIRLVAILSLPQLLLFVSFSSMYFELIVIGLVSPPGALIAAISEVCLLSGVLFLLFRGTGKLLFFIAAAGFLLSTLLVWNAYLSPIMKLSVHTTGFLLAVFGWWVAGTYGKHHQPETSGA